jgi:hypothetical protein
MKSGLNGKPAGADPVVMVERGLWLGGDGLVHKLQVHHRLGAPVLTLRQVLTQLPSAHGNSRPSGRKLTVLWIRRYFFRIRNLELPGRPINDGSGCYLDIFVAIEKKYVVKYYYALNIIYGNIEHVFLKVLRQLVRIRIKEAISIWIRRIRPWIRKH